MSTSAVHSGRIVTPVRTHVQATTSTSDTLSAGNPPERRQGL
jgi:hypothetical protein